MTVGWFGTDTIITLLTPFSDTISDYDTIPMIDCDTLYILLTWLTIIVIYLFDIHCWYCPFIVGIIYIPDIMTILFCWWRSVFIDYLFNLILLLLIPDDVDSGIPVGGDDWRSICWLLLLWWRGRDTLRYSDDSVLYYLTYCWWLMILLRSVDCVYLSIHWCILHCIDWRWPHDPYSKWWPFRYLLFIPWRRWLLFVILLIVVIRYHLFGHLLLMMIDCCYCHIYLIYSSVFSIHCWYCSVLLFWNSVMTIVVDYCSVIQYTIVYSDIGIATAYLLIFIIYSSIPKFWWRRVLFWMILHLLLFTTIVVIVPVLTDDCVVVPC